MSAGLNVGFRYFALTTATTSLNVAVVFLGSVVATPFAGTLADKWGRKWGMAVTAAIALLGAAIQSAASPDLPLLRRIFTRLDTTSLPLPSRSVVVFPPRVRNG